MRYKIGALAIIAALFAGELPAQAVPFGPATASIVYTFSPTVAIGFPNDTSTFNGGTFIFSTTGALSGSTTGIGNAVGTLSFSSTIGTTTPNVIANYLTFADTTGGSFTFDSGTVTTRSFNDNPGVSTSIALYVLGTLGDSHLGLDPTPTSLTITLNSTGNSAYSASATLSNPPAAGPPPLSTAEPASFLVLGSALVGLGLLRRRR